MIKQIKLPEQAEVKNEVPFPKWMINSEYRYIVFFDENKEGVVIISDHRPYPAGFKSKYWDMSYFEDHNEVVATQNVVE